MPDVVLIFSDGQLITLINGELLSKTLGALRLIKGDLFIGYLFLNLIGSKFVFHDGCGDHNNYIDYRKPVHHVLTVGLQIPDKRRIKQNDAKEKAAQCADGSIHDPGDVVGDKWQDQDKEPVGVHSDGPVNLHDEMEKEYCTNPEGCKNTQHGVSMRSPQQQSNMEKIKGDTDIGDFTVIIAIGSQESSNNTVDNETSQKDMSSSAFLILYVLGVFKFYQLLKTISITIFQIKKREIDFHDIIIHEKSLSEGV